MSASIHDKLKRVRKPRVHITYEVIETEGAEILRELPFIVGIMGDFSGDPTQPLRPLTERKFIQIDRDNFNDVLAGMNPGLKMRVDNKLSEKRRWRNGGRSEVPTRSRISNPRASLSRCRHCVHCSRRAPSCVT